MELIDSNRETITVKMSREEFRLICRLATAVAHDFEDMEECHLPPSIETVDEIDEELHRILGLIPDNSNHKEYGQ